MGILHCDYTDEIAASLAKLWQEKDMSVTSAANFYNNLQERRTITPTRDPASFNINMIQIYPALNQAINKWFDCPIINKSEHDIQLWWNNLDWSFWSGKKIPKFTTIPHDTHSHPLENGRKPDCSHIALGCSKSQYTVVCLNDLKSRDGMFNADDKGKVIDLSKSFFDVQRSFRSGGMTSYLCDGDKIMFFLYDGTSVLESAPMPLQGEGGLWLLSLLTTSIDALGYRLPHISVNSQTLRIEGFLGHGNFNNAFKGTGMRGVVGPIVIRQIKGAEGGKRISESEIYAHKHIMSAFESQGISRHVIQLLFVSDCGTALIEQPVCKAIATPISRFFLSKSQLLQVVQIGSALKDADSVHLDLRPSNFLVEGETVVLSDLGSMVILEGKGSRSEAQLSGTTKYGSPGMLHHLCHSTPHDPCFADDYHSVLRILYVSVIRGAYERLHDINSVDSLQITRFWEGAFSAPFWASYAHSIDSVDYTLLKHLVEEIV